VDNIASPAAVRALLQKHGLQAKKSLGQNFLIDRNILDKIIEGSELHHEDYVVEIGPGLGVMTVELARRCRGVLAIDVDTSLKPVLNELSAAHNNVRIIFGDVLKTDIEKELALAFHLPQSPPFKVCANIPYNITTPLIFQLLEQCGNLSSATLMIQKEVSDRLKARPGSKDYGRLTVTTAFYADIEPITSVSRNCFYPKPDVDSAVIKIIPHDRYRSQLEHPTMFGHILKSAFQKRRKTITNVLAGLLPLEKEEITTQLNALGIEPALRPENLSITDYIRLANKFGVIKD